MKRFDRLWKGLLRSIPWFIAIACIAWKFTPEFGKPATPQASPTVAALNTADRDLSAFLENAVSTKREVVEELSSERLESMRHAYDQSDVAGELAKRLGLSVDELKAKIEIGIVSPDPLNRAYALLLQDRRILALAESAKARQLDFERVTRIRDSYWIDANVHWENARRDLALEALSAASALTDSERDPLRWAGLRTDYGLILCELNRSVEAETIFGQVYELRRKHLGESDPMTLYSLIELAMARKAQEKYSEARTAFMRYNEILNMGLEVDHPEVEPELRSSAKQAVETSHLEDAELLFRKILDASVKKFGQDHTDVAIDLHNLAGVLRIQKKYDESLSLQRRSLKIFLAHRKSSKVPHRHELSAVMMFRQLLYDMGKSRDETEKVIADLRKESGVLE